MRDNWTETAISDVADVLSGFAFKSELFNENDGIPLIRIRDLQKRKFTEVGYTGDYEERYLVNSGDFLIGMDGGFRCYEWLGPKALLNQRVCRIQSFDKSEVVPRFVFFLVNQYLEKIEESTSFTTVKHISVKQVKDIRFPLPPITEQKRIVDVVSSVDAYIDALQHQVDAARTARNAVLHELLSAGGDDWNETTLGDVAEVLDRMRKPISAAEREKRPGKVPYYGATGQAGWIDKPIFDEELVLLGEDAIDFLNPNVHKAYLISGPSWVNNHAHVLKPRTGKVIPFFLMESLNAVDYSQFVAFGTRSKLTQGSMMGISVNLPPIAEQRRIVEIVSSMDDVIQAAERAVVEAKNLRSGLLSDLLSGEHEIPVSYDELLGAA
jgi:type I restriction enzyme S subunit